MTIADQIQKECKRLTPNSVCGIEVLEIKNDFVLFKKNGKNFTCYLTSTGKVEKNSIRVSN